MERKLVEFAGLLRQNGIRVSLAESVDTFRALDLVGLRTRATVKDALRTTLVKRAVDLAPFDNLFDLYFSGVGEIVKRSETASMDALEMSPAEFQNLLEELQRLLEEQGIELSELARALLEQDSARLEKLLRDAGKQAKADRIERA